MKEGQVFSTLRSLFRPASEVPVPAPVEPSTKPIPTRRVAASTVARGYHDPGNRAGMKRVVVTVEDELFKRIRADAVKAGVSLAEQVRQLITQAYAAKEPRQEQ